MKATKYTNKELVEVYKNLKTSAKILGFSSANDSEMIAEIELEAIKRHLNLVDGTVEETAEIETAKPETAEVSKEVVDNRKEVNSTSFIQQLYDAEYSKTLTVQGGIERFLKLAKEFVKNKSTEMSLIVDTAAQVLHDKYKLDYGTIETLEIEAYNS